MAYYWSTEHQFDYGWDTVTSFYWSRYPNPNSSHVFSEDMIESGIDSTGNLRTKRLIIKTNKLPWWGKHLFSARKVALIEESIVDPKTKTMTTYTRNIGLRMFMGTTEKNVYTIDNPGTKCEKKVWIESDIVGLRSAIKRFGIDRFKANCVKASEGLEWAIEKGQLNTKKPVSQVNLVPKPVPSRSNFISNSNLAN